MCHIHVHGRFYDSEEHCLFGFGLLDLEDGLVLKKNKAWAQLS